MLRSAELEIVLRVGARPRIVGAVRAFSPSEDIMAEKEESGLPLHDEAKARSKWRDGETFIDGGGASGPASEVDEAGRSDSGAAESPLLDGLGKRPPD